MSASKNQTKFTSPYSSLHVQKKKKKLKKKKKNKKRKRKWKKKFSLLFIILAYFLESEILDKRFMWIKSLMKHNKMFC